MCIYSVPSPILSLVVIIIHLTTLMNTPKGIGGWGGGLAEYIAVDVRFLHILPENVPRKCNTRVRS